MFTPADSAPPTRQRKLTTMSKKTLYALLLITLVAFSTGCSSTKKDYRPLGEPLVIRGL